LTLALRWQDDPLAWTYLTIHTQSRHEPSQTVSHSPGRPPSALTVVLIEPDPGIRRALAACINSQEGFSSKLTFSNPAEAIREMSSHQVDFIVVNQALAHESGAGYLEELPRIRPGLAVLPYSVFEDSDQLFKATPGGAIGYMLKRTTPSQIFEPIAGATRPLTREQIAAHVRGYFQRLSASLPSGPPSRELARLTPREHEILGLMSKGQLAKEIAYTLGISAWTVHGHVKSIFEKLNVHTRTEAVVKFLQK
jgi:DNA-binding NarL/FixJ family response regulator